MAQVRPDTLAIQYPQCRGLKHALPGESFASLHVAQLLPAHSVPKSSRVLCSPIETCVPFAGNLAFVAAAAHNLHWLGATLQQACQVCSLALESIMLHCDAHLAELQQPRQISSTSSSLGLAPLVEVLLRLTGTNATLDTLYGPCAVWKP